MGLTALLLTRLMDEAGVPLDTRDRGFTDTAGLSAEARDAVNAVANAEVARGTSASTFSPGIPVSRGQVAGLLARTLDLGVEAGRLSPPTS